MAKQAFVYISLVFCLAFLSAISCGPLDHLLTLKPKASTSVQLETVRGLIQRLLPKQAHLITVNIDEHFTSGRLDKFKVRTATSEVNVWY